MIQNNWRMQQSPLAFRRQVAYQAMLVLRLQPHPLADGHVAVRSASDSNEQHDVSPEGVCDCTTYARNQTCPHEMAALVFLRAPEFFLGLGGDLA